MENGKKSWICIICPLNSKHLEYYKSNNLKLGVRLVILEDDFGLMFLAAEVGAPQLWHREPGEAPSTELGHYRRMRNGKGVILRKIK
jgi:hypothetical protein